ncbi:ATP binding protein [Aureococcus anophagefferens]|nr:ATP binding protein [Aureococcus anophagefferens]
MTPARALAVLGALRADGWRVLSSDVRHLGPGGPDHKCADEVRAFIMELDESGGHRTPDRHRRRTVVPAREIEAIDVPSPRPRPGRARGRRRRRGAADGGARRGSGATSWSLREGKRKEAEDKAKMLAAMTPEDRDKFLAAEEAADAHDKLKSKHQRPVAVTIFERF